MANPTSAQLYQLIRKKYPAPAWAVLPQVADGTGAKAKRWADAVAMSLYPSRGLELHGFEIKVSRADWLRELANPDKAEAVAVYMDRWWVVAPPKAATVDELPPLWGLLEVRGEGLVIAKAAEELKPAPVDRVFLASLFRRVYEHGTSSADIDRAYAKGVDDERERNSKMQLGQRSARDKLLLTLSGRPSYRRNALALLRSEVEEIALAVSGLDKLVNEVVGPDEEGGE